MKILIAAASFAANMSGLQRHALNLVRCLLPEPAISTLHLVIAPWQRNLVHLDGLRSDARLKIHVAGMDQSSFSRNLWYFRKLPELAAELQVDLVHLSYPMPVNAHAYTCPTMVTLHDLYPYEIPMNFGFPKFIFNRIALQQCLRSVDAIACVSDCTLVRLKQFTPAAVWQKAVRIHNCIEAEPFPSTNPPIPELQGARFLLCVAQHRRNKNIPLLVRTFDRMLRAGQCSSDMRLAVIGISGPETRIIHRVVSSLGLGNSVSFLEGVSEPELQWCYRQCEALVAPSSTEGFGLPVVEAILAGCRVVCSDIPAFREVGDRQCRFVALGKDAEEMLAAAIVTTLKQPRRSPEPLPQFSAPVLARQYTCLYRRLMASLTPVRNARVATAFNIAISEQQIFDSAIHPAVPPAKRGSA